MAEECTESSVATNQSTTLPNWWEVNYPVPDSLTSWSITTNPWIQKNPNSNSSCEEDVSISTSLTNASNHSALTVESSRRLGTSAASPSDLIGEHVPDNQLWNHVLLSIGNNGVDLQNNDQDMGVNNYLDSLSSKSMSTAMFEPAASNYLRKLESSWEFTNSFDQKHLNGYRDHDYNMIENERLLKLSNLVSTWSIALPDHPRPCNNSISLNSSSLNSYSCFPLDHLKFEKDFETTADGQLFQRTSNGTNGIGYQVGINSSTILGDEGKHYYSVPDASNLCTSPRNFSDFISFNSRFGKPVINLQAPKPGFKSSSLPDRNKQDLQNSSPTRLSGRVHRFTNEGKKKRSEDSSETVLKKPKQETSTASSSAKQPKVKLADKITILQQIVSPFGKTDTASVLSEAIGYIKFLQEQIQLFSNPYMKSSFHKDPWGALGIDRKDHKMDMKFDLKGRGLCLVPTSFAPQVCRDNTGSDYWTPTFRGCYYR